MIATIEHDGVLELRLKRPPANALCPELITALKGAVESPGQGITALVLSGAPGMFSAGLDVPLLLTLDRAQMAEMWREFYALLRALACSPIPIAAAITGHAPAGGTVLMLFCDWRVMAVGDWKVGLNEVRVGLTLPAVVFQAFRRQVGPRHAESAVQGLLISAAEAEDIGLVEQLAPAEQVVPRAVEWCQSLLKLPQGSDALHQGASPRGLGRSLQPRPGARNRGGRGNVVESGSAGSAACLRRRVAEEKGIAEAESLP